jgi:glyoxylase-like metal-dependent hydrolase (beta-lactamase superfamily II)
MELTNTVHMIEATKGSYSYLVLGQEPVLIDTSFPGRAGKILEALRDLGLEPTDVAHILLTHHDIDHIGNAKELADATGAMVWAPAEDVPYITGEKSRPGIKKVLAAFVHPRVPQIGGTYGAGQKIGELEIIPTPGHTPGHVSILHGNVLFAGDLVMSSKGKLKPSPGIISWSTDQVKRSIREIGNRSFDVVCPAHGEPVQRGNLWDTLVDR